jgi:hypothetical protein
MSAKETPLVAEPWAYNDENEVIQLTAAPGAGEMTDTMNGIRFPWPLVERASRAPFNTGIQAVHATPEAVVADVRYLLGLHLSQRASQLKHAQAAVDKARQELCEAAQEWARFDERYPLPRPRR